MLGLGFAPAAEDETAEREPEAERPDREAANGYRLPPGRKTLPVSERLLLFGRQGLAAPLLAPGCARAEAQVHVVEDLGGFVHHVSKL